MQTTTTLLQAVIAVLQWGGADLASAFRQFGVNTRDGLVMTRVITWTRSNDTKPYVKKDVKGRLLVAQKYMTPISWGIEGSKLKIFPGIIQINVLKARGKRGGWLIGVHRQTPVLSQKTMKFVFCCRWDNYWASDAMLEKSLMVRMDKGAKIPKFRKGKKRKLKQGQARMIEDILSIRHERDILSNIRLLKKELKKNR
jgi:hypothetical protein